MFVFGEGDWENGPFSVKCWCARRNAPSNAFLCSRVSPAFRDRAIEGRLECSILKRVINSEGLLKYANNHVVACLAIPHDKWHRVEHRVRKCLLWPTLTSRHQQRSSCSTTIVQSQMRSYFNTCVVYVLLSSFTIQDIVGTHDAIWAKRCIASSAAHALHRKRRHFRSVWGYSPFDHDTLVTGPCTTEKSWARNWAIACAWFVLAAAWELLLLVSLTCSTSVGCVSRFSTWSDCGGCTTACCGCWNCIFCCIPATSWLETRKVKAGEAVVGRESAAIRWLTCCCWTGIIDGTTSPCTIPVGMLVDIPSCCCSCWRMNRSCRLSAKELSSWNRTIRLCCWSSF